MVNETKSIKPRFDHMAADAEFHVARMAELMHCQVVREAQLREMEGMQKLRDAQLQAMATTAQYQEEIQESVDRQTHWMEQINSNLTDISRSLGSFTLNLAEYNAEERRKREGK